MKIDFLTRALSGGLPKYYRDVTPEEIVSITKGIITEDIDEKNIPLGDIRTLMKK